MDQLPRHAHRPASGVAQITGRAAEYEAGREAVPAAEVVHELTKVRTGRRLPGSARMGRRKGVAMSKVTLTIPDEAVSAFQMTPEQFAGELRMAGAVKLYEMGRLSSGAAAELAGIPRTVFLTGLADYGVDTFRLTEEDFRRETRFG
jgi:predicted HTH domain antitoxin